jgi:hypothetical protein
MGRINKCFLYKVQPPRRGVIQLTSSMASMLLPLYARTPALVSHCTNPSITVAEALCDRRLGLPLQPRLTVTAQGQMEALVSSLQHATLSSDPDVRLLPGGAAFSTVAAYRIMCTSGVALPLSDFNLENFAPLKVRVFFWIARHGNTRTRALLHRHGCLPSPRCPFCDADEDLAHLFARCVRLEPLFALVEAPAVEGTPRQCPPIGA